MPCTHSRHYCGREALTASCADSGHAGCLQIDQPGSAIDAYIGGLREVLERKASNIAQLQGRLESFQVIWPCSASMGLRVSTVHGRGCAPQPTHSKICVVICCT